MQLNTTVAKYIGNLDAPHITEMKPPQYGLVADLDLVSNVHYYLRIYVVVQASS